jgi:hypothetical protein
MYRIFFELVHESPGSDPVFKMRSHKSIYKGSGTTMRPTFVLLVPDFTAYIFTTAQPVVGFLSEETLSRSGQKL